MRDEGIDEVDGQLGEFLLGGPSESVGAAGPEAADRALREPGATVAPGPRGLDGPELLDGPLPPERVWEGIERALRDEGLIG